MLTIDHATDKAFSLYFERLTKTFATQKEFEEYLSKVNFEEPLDDDELLELEKRLQELQ